MKIKGIIKTERREEFDVSEDDIISSFFDIIRSRNTKLIPYDHIENGYWQEYLYTDLHKNEEHYKRAREATKVELEFDKLLNDIRLAIKRN